MIVETGVLLDELTTLLSHCCQKIDENSKNSSKIKVGQNSLNGNSSNESEVILVENARLVKCLDDSSSQVGPVDLCYGNTANTSLRQHFKKHYGNVARTSLEQLILIVENARLVKCLDDSSSQVGTVDLCYGKNANTL